MNNIDILKNNSVDVDTALDTWGDITSYNEGLTEFQDSLNSKLTDLENFKNNHDFENYSILAHSLKSEAKYLGFITYSEVFLNHELAGKENNQDFITNDFPNLKATITKITTIIQEYFHN